MMLTTNLCSAKDLVRSADVLRARGYYRVPCALYTRALELEESEAARTGLGVSLGKLSRFVEARAALAPVFSARTAYHDQTAYWAYVLERSHEYESALAAYDLAIASVVAPDPWTLGHRAYCLEKMGRGDEAVDAYRAALAAFPEDTWSRKRFALFLGSRDDEHLGRKVLVSGCLFVKSQVLSLMNLLEFAVLKADTSLAREAAEQVRSHPEARDAHRVLVDVILWAGSSKLGNAIDPIDGSTLLARVEALEVPVHRDFDDLSAVVRASGGDVERWTAITQAFVK